MVRFDGSLARQFDFGEIAVHPERRRPVELRLAIPSDRLRGPDKYKVLEHRRRQAQIEARRLLELV